MNFHYTTFGSQIVSKSKGSTASVTLKYQPSGQPTHAYAYVGVALQPTPMWEEMKNRHVVVKVTTKTDITINGDKLVAAETGVATFAQPFPAPSKYAGVMIYRDIGSDSQNFADTQTVSGTQTNTIDTSYYSSTIGTPLTLENVSGISAMVFVETRGAFNPTISEYASSARVTVESI